MPLFVSTTRVEQLSKRDAVKLLVTSNEDCKLGFFTSSGLALLLTHGNSKTLGLYSYRFTFYHKPDSFCEVKS